MTLKYSLNELSSAECCAILSILSPFVAIGLALVINASQANFWNGLDLNDDASRNATAMAGIAEGMMLFGCALLGFLLGLGLSFFSLAWQRSKVGYVSLIVNLAPALLFLLVLLRGALSGF